MQCLFSKYFYDVLITFLSNYLSTEIYFQMIDIQSIIWKQKVRLSP